MPANLSLSLESSRDVGGDRQPLELQVLDFIHQVMDTLRSHDIEFCLLRNRDLIPSGLVKGSDVDVVVPESLTFDYLEHLFRGFHPIQVIRQQTGAGIKFVFPVAGIFLSFDFVNGDREWFGATYLTNKELLRNAVVESGIPVASGVHQAFDAWFAGLFWADDVKPRYVDLAKRVALEHPNDFGGILVEKFGPILGKQLMSLAENGQIAQSISLAGNLRRVIWRRAFQRAPIHTLRRASLYVWRRVTLRFRPPGISIALLGPDGAGKSTVSLALSDMDLPNGPFSRVESQHLHRNVLPRPKDIVRGRLKAQREEVVVVDPHGQAPHLSITSSLLAIYQLADHWLSFMIWERKNLGQNHLVVYDRHMAEIAIDPLRYRFGASTRVARLFARLAPNQDMVVLLDAPIEVLRLRKQEVAIEETARQLRAYREWLASVPNGYVVDASQPLNDVVSDIRSRILQTVANHDPKLKVAK